MVDFLKEYIQNIGIELNQDKINKLINYYELLIEKNKVNEPDSNYRIQRCSYKTLCRQSSIIKLLICQKLLI